MKPQLKSQVIDLVEKGLNNAQIMQATGASYQTVLNVRRRYNEVVAPKDRKISVHKLTEPKPGTRSRKIFDYILANPEATNREIIPTVGVTSKEVQMVRQRYIGQLPAQPVDKYATAKVFEMIEQGYSNREIVAATGVKVSTVYSRRVEYNRAAKVPKYSRSGKPKEGTGTRRVYDFMVANPEATAPEISEATQVAASLVHKVSRRFELPFARLRRSSHELR